MLKEYGVSSAKYKAFFTLTREELKEKHPRVFKLVDLICGRVRDSRTINLKEWRAWHAVDMAMEIPFSQTSTSLIQNILGKPFEGTQEKHFEAILAELRAYGIDESEVFKQVDINGKAGVMLNPPLFSNVLLPLAKSYVSMRTANLFNERNTSPFTPYEPLKDTERDKVLCEIITDIQDTISTRMGYPAVLRQAIQHTMRYGIMVMFPREEWFCEKTVEDTGEKEQDTGKKIFREVTTREGLRYTIPHPTFLGYDLNYPLTTLNTDTGTEWAMYWHVVSYGQVLDNPLYWNRKRIFSGTNWFQSPYAGNLFSEIFPCTAKVPRWSFDGNKREDKAAWYNTSNDRDTAVFITEYYMKLVPKDWGLGDYKYPVWHRFTLAGDDTVIWCEPCSYTPALFMGYDYNENDARTSSMALEAIPWANWLQNLLTQMLLTSKQNLTNVVFYDTNMVDQADINQLRDLGDRRMKEWTFIGFDSIKTRVQGLQQQAAFQSVPIQKTPITELLQMVPMMLSIMERVMQVSAQESGAQATHQQSKQEVLTTSGASGNRVIYLGSFVDEGIDAWKRQRYEASQAYADAGFVAQVSADIPDAHKLVEELGFTVKHTGKDKLLVHGKKSGLRVDEFARSSEGRLRATNAEAAQVLMSVVGTIAGQPELFKKVGAPNLLAILEFAAQLGGAPRGWKLKEISDDGKDEQVPENVLQAIQQAQQATMQSIEERIVKPIAGEMAQDKQQIEQMQQVLQQLQKIYQIAAATQDKNAIAAKDAQTKAQIREAETRQKLTHKSQEMQQKEREFQSEQQRKDAELAAELERKRIETEAAIERAKIEAAAKVDIAKKSKE